MSFIEIHLLGTKTFTPVIVRQRSFYTSFSLSFPLYVSSVAHRHASYTHICIPFLSLFKNREIMFLISITSCLKRYLNVFRIT